MKRNFEHLATAGVVALLLGASIASAQVAPPLGVLQQFSALGGSGVSGSTGAGTIVNGDVGSFPTCPVTNFPPSSVTPPFILHGPVVCDGTVATARANATAAFVALNQGPGTVIPDQMAGTIRTAGIYSFTLGTADIAGGGTLTLNGPGNFIFITGSTLTANVGSTVSFTGGANPCNVFWQVGSSATLNGVSFGGNIFASASVTVGSGSTLIGRAIAGSGAVTMAGGGGNTVGGCATAVPPVCPVISLSPASLPNAPLGVAYSQTVSASGGLAPYAMSLTSGSLPAGLTLSGSGLISGNPTGSGTSAFTVRATDANGCFADRPYTITVAPAVPTLPEVFLLLLAILLGGIGYMRLRGAPKAA